MITVQTIRSIQNPRRMACLVEQKSHELKVFGSLATKGTGKPRFEYDEAVEEALCFGWIDSKPNKLDEERSLLWFASRKTRHRVVKAKQGAG